MNLISSLFAFLHELTKTDDRIRCTFTYNPGRHFFNATYALPLLSKKKKKYALDGMTEQDVGPSLKAKSGPQQRTSGGCGWPGPTTFPSSSRRARLRLPPDWNREYPIPQIPNPGRSN